jgi:hypothetical protein
MIKIRRRKIFRWCVDFADNINFWFQERFDLNPKRVILERKQDMVSTQELERTIGKSLGITGEK